MLPIEAVLPALTEALRDRAAAVLVAEPGAGKTTRAPLALLQEPWAAGGKLILLAPRRIAARAGAARMAQILGEPVGATIGFRVRLESRVGPATRLEVVTEGVFTRMILDDPALTGVAGVIFDEFHERSLEGDLGLALALDAQNGLRPDLRLLVMSATIEAAPIAAMLGQAPVIASAGRAHAVSVRYLGRPARDDPAAGVADAARRALAQERGSILCFLPGAGEIERAARLLHDAVADPCVDIRPLYGALSPAAQDAAIAACAPGRRKIVLASAIAETSLTIEGVRVVIDSGLSRRARFEPSTGLTRLVTTRVSQAGAAQRAGRAGRLEPGSCWRLWDEGETRALPAFDPPAILESDLAGLALDLASWGVPDPGMLSWLDPPPKAAWAQAVAHLKALNALDADGRLTPHGRRLARLPLAPLLGHMAARAAGEGRGLLAARLAALLAEPGLGGRDIDLRMRLAAFGAESSARARAARALAGRIARAAGAAPEEPVDSECAGRVLAFAFPERLAKPRGGPGEFSMANGGAARLDPADPLARAPMLVIADIAGRADRQTVLAAAPIAPREAELLFADRIETLETVRVEPGTGAIRARRVRRLARLVLEETPLERPAPAAVAQAVVAAVRSEGLALLPWTPEAMGLRARMALLAKLEPGGAWPDWSDAGLERALEDWLAAAIGDKSLARLDDLAPALAPALLARLDYPSRTRLDAEAPTHWRTPAGLDRAILYQDPAGPALEVRLQEMFGLDRHPTIAGGRVRLLVRLLSPAQRPIQTTSDLPGFWRGSYAGVRADLRGRYPKHAWPEDPLAAAPTARAKARPP